MYRSLTIKIIFLRSWSTIEYGTTFTDLKFKGAGGTELQLLRQAEILKNLGNQVEIIGITKSDVIENDILFKGCANKSEILQYLNSISSSVDIIFTNISEGYKAIRGVLTNTFIIEVCQNGPHFKENRYIDFYALIGLGQFAYYNAKYRKHRNKFLLLTSVPLYYSIHSNIKIDKKENQIIWVGSLNKQGLRRWGLAMKEIMDKYKNIKWILCVPSYDKDITKSLPSAIQDIKLPTDRISFKNLDLNALSLEIKKSRMLLCSLGGEDGPVSYLDGHALGVPTLCGDDIFGKYYNPEGTGLRCTTINECKAAIDFILRNPVIADEMGNNGKSWIEQNLTERHQEINLKHLTSFLQMLKANTFPKKDKVQSDRKFSFEYYKERLQIKYAQLRISRSFKKY